MLMSSVVGMCSVSVLNTTEALGRRVGVKGRVAECIRILTLASSSKPQGTLSLFAFFFWKLVTQRSRVLKTS